MHADSATAPSSETVPAVAPAIDDTAVIALCAVGRKGLQVLRGLADVHPPAVVVSYPQDGDADGSFADMSQLCGQAGIPFVRDRHVLPVVVADVDLLFLVGWQYPLTEVDERTVIFHDSLLPRYRGCAATVTALVNGEHEVGVTALRPDEVVDSGPVLAQRRWTVQYPMTIADALDRQAACMVDVLLDLVAAWEDGRLHSRPQDESLATYSLWRDGDDGLIDWSWDAARICRFVDAVGFPYSGAHTSCDGAAITVTRAEVVDDLHFEERVPGKIWSLTPDGPVVVCGTGMVRIREARDATGAAAVFGRRRRRLGAAGRAHALLAP